MTPVPVYHLQVGPGDQVAQVGPGTLSDQPLENGKGEKLHVKYCEPFPFVAYIKYIHNVKCKVVR